MIPVIDLQAQDALNRIEEAYTTVGFAVFTNCLSDIDQEIMNLWFNKMKEFFQLPLSVKKKYLYQPNTNLGYSVMGAEHVDPDAPSDMKESYNYNDTRMDEALWPTEVKFKNSALASIKIADNLTLRILEKFDTILDCGLH